LNDKAVGKRFGRLKRSLGFGDDLVFHSIRKTFATVCEQQGINEGVAADLLGHEKQTMTYGLYSGGSSVTQKKTVIDIIDDYLDLEVQFFDLENQQIEP
jgi:integrase